jgi:signal transduction histidine kinase
MKIFSHCVLTFVCFIACTPWAEDLAGQKQTIVIHNPSSLPQEKILSLGIPDAYELRIWQANLPIMESVISLTTNSQFYERLIWNRTLQVPITLPAEQTSEWIIEYRTHGKTPLHLEVLTPQENRIRQSRSDLINGIIFGVMLLLIPLLTIYQQGASYSIYAGLVLSNLLFIAQIEGYFFTHLWPRYPGWNMQAPGVFGLCVLVFHSLFAINFLQLYWRFPILYRFHWALILFALLLMLLHLLLTVDSIIMILTALYSSLAVFTAWKVIDQVAPARFYLLGSVSLIIFSVILLGISVFWQNPIPSINALQYPKIGYLLESLFFAMAVISQWRNLAERQAQTRVKRLAETEQLLHAEQARIDALSLAKQKQLQLASASHDISQPLASIRYALTALSLSESQQGVTQHIDKSLQYAQTLLQDILNQSKQEWNSVTEIIVLSDVFSHLENDFFEQVQAKNLQLTIVNSRIVFDGSHLILYRILSNLLSNAIRYTSRGRVLVGARRRRDGFEIQIADTGIGIPQPLIQLLSQPFVQGETKTQGYGLGLFIVKNLCQQSGYGFKVQSTPKRGSLFAIRIPYSCNPISSTAIT